MSYETSSLLDSFGLYSDISESWAHYTIELVRRGIYLSLGGCLLCSGWRYTTTTLYIFVLNTIITIVIVMICNDWRFNLVRPPRAPLGRCGPILVGTTFPISLPCGFCLLDALFYHIFSNSCVLLTFSEH